MLALTVLMFTAGDILHPDREPVVITHDFAAMTEADALALAGRRHRIRVARDSDPNEVVSCLSFDCAEADDLHRNVRFRKGVKVDEDAEAFVVEARVRVVLHCGWGRSAGSSRCGWWMRWGWSDALPHTPTRSMCQPARASPSGTPPPDPSPRITPLLDESSLAAGSSRSLTSSPISLDSNSWLRTPPRTAARSIAIRLEPALRGAVR